MKLSILIIFFLLTNSCAQSENPYSKPSTHLNDVKASTPLNDEKVSTPLDEGEALFKKWSSKYKLESLVARIRKHQKNNRLKSRTFDYYRKDTIFLMKELKEGILPHFVQGDFDCDKKTDKAIILSDSAYEHSDKTYVLLASGKLSTLGFAADSISLGKPGIYKTIKGKGYNVPKYDPMPAEFHAKCDFLDESYWEKAGGAYVYDIGKKKFVHYPTSD